MRILHILPNLTYNGGIESCVLNYYNKIEGDISFDFIAHENIDDKLVKQINDKGGQVFSFPRFSILNLKKIYNEFSLILQANKYDVIHCHAANMSFFYLYIANSYHVPVRVLHSHQSSYADTLFHKIRNIPLIYCGKRFSTHFAACSKKAGDFLFFPRKYTLVNNAIDTNKYEFNSSTRLMLRKFNDLDNYIVMGQIGRFNEQKNHLFSLKVLYLLKKRFPDRYKLCLFGDGPLKERIISEIKRLSLEEDVIFFGVKNNLYDYYNMLDLVVMPSLYEGLSVAAVECQANGLPLILSDRVAAETKINDNVVLLPLIEKKWVDKIVSVEMPCRLNGLINIQKSGFDINLEAKNLILFYRNCLSNAK